METENSKKPNGSTVENGDKNGEVPEGLTFEQAISETGFGKFNFLMMFLALPAGFSPMFATTTMSYVFPVAQCDLELSLENKGSLNAITYLGMISSGFIWGYLADTIGRKRLLIIGYGLDAVFVFLGGLSQSFEVLMVFKFFSGLAVNGPFAVFTVYLSEFHSAKYRSKLLMMLGFIYTVAALVLPLLAWAVFPLYLEINIINSAIVLHSWNIYLFICALPSLVSFILMCFMPESPKFLMTMGHNKEALGIFQKIFNLNTGKPKEQFPVKSLIDEIKLHENDRHSAKITENRTAFEAFKGGVQQLKPLFYPPHLLNAILVCVMQTGFIMGNNTLRLWAPQIFTAISNYQQANSGEAAALCDVLDYVQPNITVLDEGNVTCFVDVSSGLVYLNSMIVAMVSAGSYIVAGLIINRIGKKGLMFSLALYGTFAASLMYLSPNTAVTVTLLSSFLACASVCTSLMLAVIVDTFPTYLRTMMISIAMAIGRIGALSGNIIFPLLIRLGCLPPFIMSGVLFGVNVLLTILLPRTNLKALE